MSGFECRYIRIYITRSKTLFFFFQLAQIAEIEVYGCDSGEDFPVPVSEQDTIKLKSNVHHTEEKTSTPLSTPLNKQAPGIPGKPVIRFID